MRIGMMADAYKPHISGITNYISLNKRFLEKAGHEVFVFTFGGDDYQDDETNIIRTRGLPLVDSGYYVSVRFSTEAQKILRTMDVVHVHHPFSSGRMALRYCKPIGIPIIFTNHTRYDLYAQYYLPIVPEALGDAFFRAFLPSFCRSCDLVIAPSAGLKEVLRNLGVDATIEIVPNGVDIQPFRAPVRKIPRQELGFRDDDILLTYMGRLGPEKNLPFLLHAFRGIARTFEQVGLLIIGDGPERENLQGQAHILGISDRVRFTGMIPYQDLPNYLAAADAFVTASITEVHPLSLIESMAAGLPVVGILSPGIGDTVEDGISGLLAAEEDKAEFTAKLARMVTDHDLRRQMSLNAYQAAENYSIEHTLQVMLNHYQQVIANSVKGRRRFWGKLRRKISGISS